MVAGAVSCCRTSSSSHVVTEGNPTLRQSPNSVIIPSSDWSNVAMYEYHQELILTPDITKQIICIVETETFEGQQFHKNVLWEMQVLAR